MAGEALALTALEAVGLVTLDGLLGIRSRERRIFWTSANGADVELPFQIVVEEDHHDEMNITQHPVERDASISDHAYKYPASVVIKAGWSFSGSSPLSVGLGQFQVASSIIPNPPDPNYLDNLYKQLLDLQKNRILFNIICGKRSYQNMLLHRLSTRTERKTENSLMITADCRELNIVDTQVVSVGSSANHANPSLTAPVVNTGAVQTVPATNFNGIP